MCGSRYDAVIILFFRVIIIDIIIAFENGFKIWLERKMENFLKADKAKLLFIYCI